MSNSVRPYGQQLTRLLCPQDSPGKNPGVGCHFLLRLDFTAPLRGYSYRGDQLKDRISQLCLVYADLTCFLRGFLSSCFFPQKSNSLSLESFCVPFMSLNGRGIIQREKRLRAGSESQHHWREMHSKHGWKVRLQSYKDQGLNLNLLSL